MALRDLLAALDAESSAELELGRQEREREAGRILAAARVEADRARTETIAAARARAGEEARQILAGAREEARRVQRRARVQALEAVHDAVGHALAGLPGTDDGAAATAESLTEAVAVLASATRVHVHPADAAAFSGAATEWLEVLTDLDDGGVLLEGDAGLSVDNTWRTRFDNIWPGLRIGLNNEWST
jgi:vacuolar-type H+-ATPase subunit E/Vma4